MSSTRCPAQHANTRSSHAPVPLQHRKCSIIYGACQIIVPIFAIWTCVFRSLPPNLTLFPSLPPRTTSSPARFLFDEQSRNRYADFSSYTTELGGLGCAAARSCCPHAPVTQRDSCRRFRVGLNEYSLAFACDQNMFFSPRCDRAPKKFFASLSQFSAFLTVFFLLRSVTAG